MNEPSDSGAKVDVDKKDAVREAQAANVGHAPSLARTSEGLPKPTVRKALTVATRYPLDGSLNRTASLCAILPPDSLHWLIYLVWQHSKR